MAFLWPIYGGYQPLTNWDDPPSRLWFHFSWTCISPSRGKWSNFDEHIFQMDWNQQLTNSSSTTSIFSFQPFKFFRVSYCFASMWQPQAPSPPKNSIHEWLKFIYPPPGNDHIVSLGKRKIIDLNVPWLAGDMLVHAYIYIYLHTHTYIYIYIYSSIDMILILQ